MKVFISWSGEPSRIVAEALQDWLPRVINAVDPWISTEMGKGVRWSEQLSVELDSDAVGLLCLTRDNLEAPWINYEAGALAKTRRAVVWTYLIGITHSDVKPPLAQFNHTLASRDDTRKLVATINQHVADGGERALSDKHLDDAFQRYWPDLESALRTATTQTPGTKKPRARSPDDMIVEILGLVRTISEQNRAAVRQPREQSDTSTRQEALIDSAAVASLIERMLATGSLEEVRLPLDYFNSQVQVTNVRTLLLRRRMESTADESGVTFYRARGPVAGSSSDI
jgi:hypothetical protein